MKKIIFIPIMLFCPSLFAGTLTTNNVPYVCQGGNTPQLCNSNIITAAGNVGIGSPNPGAKLDITGAGGTAQALNINAGSFSSASNAVNIYGNYTGDMGFSLKNTNTGGHEYIWYVTGSGEGAWGGAGGGMGIYDNTAAAWRFGIKPDGNVGIGSPNPGAKLDITGAGGTAQALNINAGSFSSASNAVDIFGNYTGDIGLSLRNANTGGHEYIWYVTGSGEGAWGGAGGGMGIYDNTAAAWRFGIKPDGNVGIGTTNPGNGLDVVGDARLKTSASSGRAALTLGDNTYDNGSGYIYYINSNSQINWKLSTNDTVSGDFEIAPSTAGGGTTWAAPTLKLSNTAGTVLFAAWTYNSDRRLKENIQYLNGINAMKIIGMLKPATFDYINGAKNNAGFIAQDVREILPNLVTVEPKGMLGLKTTELIPYMIKGMQELDEEVSALKEENRDLKSVLCRELKLNEFCENR